MGIVQVIGEKNATMIKIWLNEMKRINAETKEMQLRNLPEPILHIFNRAYVHGSNFGFCVDPYYIPDRLPLEKTILDFIKSMGYDRRIEGSAYGTNRKDFAYHSFGLDTWENFLIKLQESQDKN